jgi:hypothetical protein
VLLTIPTVAAAQSRVPAAESAAIGGEAGVFLPTDDRLGPGPVVEGFYEYYLTARNSLRVGAGVGQPDFDRESEDGLRHVRIAIDTAYNWERGAVHPFVGAGIGIYILQFRDNGRSLGDSESKLGGTLFGGAEFFTSRRVSIKAEGRYHIVRDIQGVNPDGLSLTIGVKRYF